jgi:hypothetical protein
VRPGPARRRRSRRRIRRRPRIRRSAGTRSAPPARMPPAGTRSRWPHRRASSGRRSARSIPRRPGVRGGSSRCGSSWPASRAGGGRAGMPSAGRGTRGLSRPVRRGVTDPEVPAPVLLPAEQPPGIGLPDERLVTLRTRFPHDQRLPRSPWPDRCPCQDPLGAEPPSRG